MFDSKWLDVAIGVVFVWFLFSLFVTFVNELIQRGFALRSKQLWKALSQMLDGRYKPLVLFTSAFSLFGFRSRPNRATPADDATLTEKLYATQTVQAVENRSPSTFKTRISDLPPKIFTQALIEMGATAGKSLDDWAEELPDATPLKSQLLTLLASAGNDMKDVRTVIEDWFDGQMKRLSAAYKARMRYVLTPVGIVIAFVAFGLGMRADSLALLRDVQHDANLRSVLVGAATEATRSDLAKLGCPDKPTSGTTTSTTTSTTTTTQPSSSAAAAAAPTGAGEADKLATAKCQILGVKKLSRIDLAVYAQKGTGKTADKTFWDLIGDAFSHWRIFVGVLITGFAISFGSTFWYDVLRRLVGMRSQRAAGS